jgi:hypothetical protein
MVVTATYEFVETGETVTIDETHWNRTDRTPA